MRNNTVYGLAAKDLQTVSSAEEILELLEKNPEKAKLANLFLLVPLAENIPTYVVSIQPAVKNEDANDVREWFESARKFGLASGIHIIGVGADGDAKVRKFFNLFFAVDRKLEENESIITLPNLLFGAVVEESGALPAIFFPDWKHLLKKWRNQVLNVKRLLMLGKGMVMLEHLMEIHERFVLLYSVKLAFQQKVHFHYCFRLK